MINFIAWILLGALLGWVASITLNAGAGKNTVKNIVVGIMGASVTGGVVATLFGIANVNRNNLSLVALGVSLAGAIILLVLFNFFQRGSLR